MSSNEVSLKEYVELKIDSIDKATTLAKESMELRLNSMNEFRATLKDQAGQFITRNELNIIIERISIDIKNLNTAKDIMTGKASQSSVLFSYALAIIGILISVYSLTK